MNEKLIQAGADDDALEPMRPADAATTLTDDKIDAIIRLAHRTAELGAAMDKLQRFVLSRALAGDFVAFGNGNDAKVELTGAGAMRIARDIGVSFSNWQTPKRTDGEDSRGKWFEWEYACDVSLGNRVIERVEGRCGSRDKFFGFANGEWKSVEDVSEANIKTAARRNAMKEGVKLILGLHHIPVSEAARLGLAVEKIKGVSFANRAAEQSAAAQSAGQTGESTETITIEKMTMATKNKKDGSGTFTVFTAHTADGMRYDTFSETLAKKLKDAEGTPVTVRVKATRWGKTIEAIVETP